MPGATRTMVLWCPDWPITAALRETGQPPGTALALVDRGEVFACSPAARQDGVLRGLRIREAQARCPELQARPYDPALDERMFEPVITAIERIMPGVQPVRPGLCALRAQGPARYYGGERQAAAVLLETLAALGIPGARAGIADAPFAAEQAARAAGTSVSTPASPSARGVPEPAHGASGAECVAAIPVHIVEPGGSPAFLQNFSLEVLGQPRLAMLLRRLGITTLGAFAALDPADVRNRFGADGAMAHRMASGQDHHGVVPRTPPPELAAAVDLEPPLTRIDQLAFTFRASAGQFTAGLRRAGLVCTVLRVRIHSESGEVSDRLWRHPRWFDDDDVLDRVRWQLQGGTSIDHGLSSGVTRVQVSPETVEDLADHADGLWGSGPDERIHHGLARVQSMLGHGAVLTAVLTGGRMLADRRVFIPWGDPPSGPAGEAGARRDMPWPGKLPGPAPATVFREPMPVQVWDASGRSVDVDHRGLPTAAPDRFSPVDSGVTAHSTVQVNAAIPASPTDPAGPAASLSPASSLEPSRKVQAWAGPWPVDERWWDASGRMLHRFQVVDDTGDAWLLLLEDHRWWAEASYD